MEGWERSEIPPALIIFIIIIIQGTATLYPDSSSAPYLFIKKFPYIRLTYPHIQIKILARCIVDVVFWLLLVKAIWCKTKREKERERQPELGTRKGKRKSKGKDLPRKQQGIGVAAVSYISVGLCKSSPVEQVAASQYFSDHIYVVSAGTC